MYFVYSMDWNGHKFAEASIDRNAAHGLLGDGDGYDSSSTIQQGSDGTGDGQEGNGGGNGLSLPVGDHVPTVAIETMLLSADVPW